MPGVPVAFLPSASGGWSKSSSSVARPRPSPHLRVFALWAGADGAGFTSRTPKPLGGIVPSTRPRASKGLLPRTGRVRGIFPPNGVPTRPLFKIAEFWPRASGRGSVRWRARRSVCDIPCSTGSAPAATSCSRRRGRRSLPSAAADRRPSRPGSCRSSRARRRSRPVCGPPAALLRRLGATE